MAKGYKAFQKIENDANFRIRERKRLKEQESEQVKVLKDYPELKKDHAMKVDNKKYKIESLKKFADFLSRYTSIDGYMEPDENSTIENAEGKVKQTFRQLGKKAFKELADYLDLEHPVIDFKPGGPAVSGDLDLMGMYPNNKGIYIALNRDGNTNGVLYRLIKNIKDYTGGMNNWFAESELAEPEVIKEKIYRLLHLEQINLKSQTVKSNPPDEEGIPDNNGAFNSTATEDDPDSVREKTLIEESKATIEQSPLTDNRSLEERLTNALTKSNTQFPVKELYQKLSAGRNPELLATLINYFLDKKFREEIKIWKLKLYGLLEEETFRNNLTVNLWTLIPDNYKKVRTINPIKWEADPMNPGLREILADFVGKDELRPILMGPNFDGKGVVATDANKLIFLNSVNSVKQGVFCITKYCFRALEKQDQNEVEIKGHFPDYVAVLPKEVKVVWTVPTQLLRQYCHTLMDVGLINEYTHAGALCYSRTKFIGVNLMFLLSEIEALEKLGYHSVDIGIIECDKPILVAPEGKLNEIQTLTTPFTLLMPLVPNENEGQKNYTLLRGEMYFDLSDKQIYGFGIENTEKAAILTPKETIRDTDTLALLAGGEWFKRNPEKVLGEPYQTTDRFGKTMTKIREHEKNSEPEAKEEDIAPTEESSEILETEIKEPLNELLEDPKQKANITKVLYETKKIYADKTLRKLTGENTGECLEGTFCFDDTLKGYNQEISEEEIKAWIWYKRKTGGLNDEKVILDKKNGWSKYVIPLSQISNHLEEWVKSNVVCYYNGDHIPNLLYYAENIYEKQSDLLKEKEEIIREYGQDQFDRQWEGLEKIKPAKLTLSDPVVWNRLFIKPDSAFAKEMQIQQLADGTELSVYSAKQKGFIKGSVSLLSAFESWLNTVPKDEFKKSTQWDIINYYLAGATPSRNYDKTEKLRLKQNAKAEGDQFFVRFLAEAITREDQLRIEQIWNSRYNGYVDINYQKVPIGFTCSSTFKNMPLFIRNIQREGIGFISAQGSGCIAYDVGLGKTMTGILSLAQAMEMGQCKRPVIIVPNQTYKNWLAEIRGVIDQGKIVSTGLIPQYPVNDLYNLGTNYLAQLRDEKGNVQPVPEYSISVMTYEGFNRLSFGEDTWEQVGNELYSILNQGIDKKRDQQKLSERIEEMMGKGIKGGMAEIEDLGFDYAIVDEAHAMKKSFTQVKGDIKGDDESRAKGGYEIHSGEPSMTALRGFMIAQFILRRNKMRNVLLLTATPFTNSPLEIYSILALIGYQQLERWGIKNIKVFFDTFVKTSNELIINAKLKPERREIVLGFHNLIALQQLIYKFINYKTGEDAKIQRPNKIVLPLVNKKEGNIIVPLPLSEQISTNLQMTAQQKAYMQDIESYVRGQVNLDHFCVNAHGYEDEDESAEKESPAETLDENNLSADEIEGTRILRGLSFARQVALSPFLYACNPNHNPTYAEYIETSPKLKYVVECIRTVKLYHEEHDEEVSGQIIYMNAGVHFFPLIKEYLVKKIGYKEEEIGIIKSGMSTAKKEGIKERFLGGSVKIIIGSASIKEGINLQTRSTVLYNCWLDWNPTDVKQLIGRLWRFGNIFANVRIVNPLMEDSIDSFIFQKQEEKTSRINEIWYRAGRSNTLNLEEFNPAELKMGLITDPYALAELILMSEREKLHDEITSIENQKKMLTDIAEQRDIFNKNIGHIKTVANHYRPLKEDAQNRSTETLLKIFADYLSDENADQTYEDSAVFDQVRKANTFIKRSIEQILEPRGLDITFDVKKTSIEMDKEIAKIQNYMEEKTGDKAVQSQAEKIISDRIKRGYKPKSVMERVEEFAKLNPQVLSELMVYDNSEEAKTKSIEQNKKGEVLEATADRLTKIIELRDAFKRMKNRLDKIKALRNAA